MSKPETTGAVPKRPHGRRDHTKFKLKGNNNFLEWQMALRNSLAARGLLHYLTDDAPARPALQQPAAPGAQSFFTTALSQASNTATMSSEFANDPLKKWRSDRARCYQIIMNSLSDTAIETLVNNEPEVFSITGKITFTNFLGCYDAPESERQLRSTLVAERSPKDWHELDGPDPKDLYELICECYPYTKEEDINEVMKEMEHELIAIDGYEETLGEAMARFRFLKRSLTELGLGKTEPCWNRTLRSMINETKCALSDPKSRGYLFDQILLCKREKRWRGVTGGDGIRGVENRAPGRFVF